jgi:hypothetical protein
MIIVIFLRITILSMLKSAFEVKSLGIKIAIDLWVNYSLAFMYQDLKKLKNACQT